MTMSPADTLGGRIAAITGTLTLRLENGADLTGTATLNANRDVVTLTAGAVVWTIPTTSIRAVGV